MDNLSNTNESYDLGDQPSPCSVDQNDHSATDTTEYSPLSLDSFGYCRTNSEVSAFSDPTDESSYSNEPSPSLWPVTKPIALSRLGMKQHKHVVGNETDDHEATDSELELMREKFAKLLLGEDMSGSGKGVCTAVTISNAITNLYATVFGQNLRLEPLTPEKKSMWKREMNCLLSVCDYILEFIPTSQNLQDGTIVEVMASRPRSDIYINLPALQKLDAMLIEILESFQETEFWYVEQGNMSISSTSSTRSGSFRRAAQRKEEKWWLPVPCVPTGGLSEKSRKHLRHKRDCANQIHKAAMAINSSILAEMEIPESYMAALPKSGKASVGDSIYRYMYTADKFSPDHLLDCLNLTSEHEALELADRVEASMYTWRRKSCMSHSKSSWDLVKDLMSETDRSDKNHMLAERAESLLFGLKQRYPELSQIFQTSVNEPLLSLKGVNGLSCLDEEDDDEEADDDDDEEEEEEVDLNASTFALHFVWSSWFSFKHFFIASSWLGGIAFFISPPPPLLSIFSPSIDQNPKNVQRITSPPNLINCRNREREREVTRKMGSVTNYIRELHEFRDVGGIWKV